MTTSEIFEIIKNHKRFSKFSYDTYFEYVLYTIGGNEYKITISDSSNKLTFNCDLYNIGMADIKIELCKYYTTTYKVLFKFGEVIRYLKKANFFRIKRNSDTAKFKPEILSYIKNEHSLVFIENSISNGHHSGIFRVDFPQTCCHVRRKYKSGLFDVVKEKKTTEIKYKIYVSISNDIYWNHSFYFDYYSNTKKLILTLRTEYYRIPINLTKVIRSEKLKNLMNYNAE